MIAQLTVQQICAQIQIDSPFSVEKTKQMIGEKFEDEEIYMDYICESLICPLTLNRPQLPARSNNCSSHLKCFDLHAYIQLNMKGSKWVCPVCSAEASISSLYVDEYFLSIISQLRKNPFVNKIQFTADGNWLPCTPSQSPIKQEEVDQENLCYHFTNVFKFDDDVKEEKFKLVESMIEEKENSTESEEMNDEFELLDQSADLDTFLDSFYVNSTNKSDTSEWESYTTARDDSFWVDNKDPKSLVPNKY